MEPNQNDINLKEIQTESIKKVVVEHLDKMGIAEKVRELDLDVDDEEEAIKKIKSSGIINEIMESLKMEPKSPFEDDASFPKNKLGLYIKIEQGHNFIDYDLNNIGNPNNDIIQYFQFDVQFCGQRFHSRKIPTSGDFMVDETFLLDFNPLDYDIELTYNILKKRNTPCHIVILLYEPSGNVRMVASKSIEWRWALSYGSWKLR